MTYSDHYQESLRKNPNIIKQALIMKSDAFCIFIKVLVGHLGFKNQKLLLSNIFLYTHIRIGQNIKSRSHCFDVPVL